MNTRIFIYCIVIILPQLVWSQQNEITKKVYNPQLIHDAPKIDGILDDEVWETGTWETGFTQFEPNNGQPASQETSFCILYDADYLYVGIKAYDTSPDSIVTRLTRRDSNDGDAVGVVFDSYFDLRTAFLLGVSAGETRFDQIMTEDGRKEDSTWDANWWAKTSVNDYGWEAEMRIPFSQLRFKKSENPVWGLQVFRQLHRKGELSFWQHIDADAPGLIHRIGEMHGMNGIEPKRIFDITPYTVTSAESYPRQADNPFATGSDQNLKVGLDAKVGVTNDFTLDLTVNPDFGQVEADPSEVNLTAFETFFQEKRPFFIEGRNISSFQLGIGNGGLGHDNLFYSRRIGRRPTGQITTENGSYINRPSFTSILGAAKLTGKSRSGLSIAIIESVTRETKAEIDLLGERSFKTIEPLTNYLVGRVQKDFNEGNTILGGMFTSTHRKTDDNLSKQMHNEAYSGGIDFTRYFKDKEWMFNINAALSHVAGTEEAILLSQRAPARYFQRPDNKYATIDSARTSLTGSGGRAQLIKTSGHLNMMAAVMWKSPEFEINDLGYMREADYFTHVIWLGYREWEPRGIYRSFNVNFNQYTFRTFSGEHLNTGINTSGFIRFRNYWSANAGMEYNHNLTSVTLLRGGPAFQHPDRINTWFGVSTDNRAKFVAGVSANRGHGLENEYKYLRLGPNFTLKPTASLNLSFNPSWSKRFDELQYITQKDFQDEKRYLFGSIDQHVINFSFRINYTIIPDLTIQYWGQPFVASGKYSDFKVITNPKHEIFQERFHIYDASRIELIEDNYHVDENGDGNMDYQFGKPDFNFREFLSNLVIRWEFQPGSSLYLVWSQTRSDFEINGKMTYMDHLDQLFSQKPHNIFLLKVSYRFGVTG